MKNNPWFTTDFESFGHLLEEEEEIPERVSFKLGQSDSEWVIRDKYCMTPFLIPYDSLIMSHFDLLS